jgi:hypothetical protein
MLCSDPPPGRRDLVCAVMLPPTRRGSSPRRCRRSRRPTRRQGRHLRSRECRARRPHDLRGCGHRRQLRNLLCLSAVGLSADRGVLAGESQRQPTFGGAAAGSDLLPREQFVKRQAVVDEAVLLAGQMPREAQRLITERHAQRRGVLPHQPMPAAVVGIAEIHIPDVVGIDIDRPTPRLGLRVPQSSGPHDPALWGGDRRPALQRCGAEFLSRTAKPVHRTAEGPQDWRNSTVTASTSCETRGTGPDGPEFTA